MPPALTDFMASNGVNEHQKGNAGEIRLPRKKKCQVWIPHPGYQNCEQYHSLTAFVLLEIFLF